MQGWREIIEVLDRHPSLCVAIASLFSAFVSAVIAGSFALFSAISRRRSEELRLRSDIAVRVGVESFKYVAELSKSIPSVTALFPLEYWILCSVKLAELISMKKITTEIAKTKMQEVIKFTQEIGEALQKNQLTTGLTPTGDSSVG